MRLLISTCPCLAYAPWNRDGGKVGGISWCFTGWGDVRKRSIYAQPAMETSSDGSYLVCAEGPPFLAIGPMDKTHDFIGHSDGQPTQSSTTPLSVCSGRAVPFRPCCGKLCRHAIDAERRDQGARGTAGPNAVRAQPSPRDADALGERDRDARPAPAGRRRGTGRVGPQRAGAIVRAAPVRDNPNSRAYVLPSLLHHLALQLPFMKISESMGNHDSKIVDAGSVG